MKSHTLMLTRLNEIAGFDIYAYVHTKTKFKPFQHPIEENPTLD